MTNGIGRALWEIYQDAVQNMPDETNGGVAGASLKFITAFERELEAAKIDVYCKSAHRREPNNEAKTRRNRLGFA